MSVRIYPGRTYRIGQAYPPIDGSFFLGWCTQGRNAHRYPSINVYKFNTAKKRFEMRDFPEYGEVIPDVWTPVPPFELKSWPQGGRK